MKRLILILIFISSIIFGQTDGIKTNIRATTNHKFRIGALNNRYVDFEILQNDTTKIKAVLNGITRYLVFQNYVDSLFAELDSLSSGVPTNRTLTINGVNQDLSANRTWTVGNVRKEVSDTISAYWTFDQGIILRTPTFTEEGSLWYNTTADKLIYSTDGFDTQNIASESYVSTALSSYVPTTRSISTTSPLSGGGNLSSDRTLSIANAAADGSTKGASTYLANDFNDNGSGLISIDWTNTYSGYLSGISSGVQGQLNAKIGLTSLSASAPLVYNNSTGAFSLKYSALNLRTTTDSLNTIQNIATTSSPTFAGLTINGTSNLRTILPQSTDAYDFGSSTLLWRKGWLSELESLVFAENTISLLGGWFYVTKDQGTIDADVNNSQTTINFGKAMTPNDFVVFRGNSAVEYIQVGSNVSGYTYNVTRNVDGSGANAWPAGAPFAVLGYNGSGRIELNAYNTPRISLIRQGTTYNNQTELIRIGDLNGLADYSSESYGIFIGDYAGGKWLAYDPTNSLRIRGDALIDGTVTAGKLSVTSLSAITANIGTISTAASGKRVVINGTNNSVDYYSASGLAGAIYGGTSGIIIEGNLSLYEDLTFSGATTGGNAFIIDPLYGYKFSGFNGSTYPSSVLNSEGLYFGSPASRHGSYDVNIYRSAANVLKTDDAFHAAGGSYQIDASGNVTTGNTYSGNNSISGNNTLSGNNTINGAIFFDNEIEITPTADANQSVSGKNSLIVYMNDVAYTITLTGATDGQLLYVINDKDSIDNCIFTPVRDGTNSSLTLPKGKSALLRYRNSESTWYVTNY